MKLPVNSLFRINLPTLILASIYFSPAAHTDESLDPVGLMLTWQSDPTTTMTIDWQRTASQLDQPSIIEYRERGTEEWITARAERIDFPFSDRKIDRVEITGLQPGTAYDFRGHPDSPVFYFRTAPATLEEPLVIAVGGDTRHHQNRMERINKVAMSANPEFIYWGGDYAYADGEKDKLYRWYEWFDANRKTLIAEDGRVPAVVGAIGNHEVQRGYTWGRTMNEKTRLEIAPYYYTFFAFPGMPGYGVLDFGDYLSLVVLDSDHTNEIPGTQTAWLDEVLSERQNVPHVLPIYHVPAYPSNRSYEDRRVVEVRNYWTPVFDKYNIRMAFENHDHLYKRTHPIRGEKIDPEGVVYLGDGAWGVWTRDPHPVYETWYLKEAENTLHAIIVTLYPDRQEAYALNDHGERIDEVLIQLGQPVPVDAELIGLGPESQLPATTYAKQNEATTTPDSDAEPTQDQPMKKAAPGSGQLVLHPNQITLESGEGDPTLMLSRQETIGDPRSGTGLQPTEGWRPSWQFRNYPVSAIIDLEKPHRLDYIYFYDANSDGIIRFEAEVDGEWVELFSDDQKKYNRWVGYPVDVTTQRVRFISESRVIPNEVVFYGEPL